MIQAIKVRTKLPAKFVGGGGVGGLSTNISSKYYTRYINKILFQNPYRYPIDVNHKLLSILPKPVMSFISFLLDKEKYSFLF